MSFGIRQTKRFKKPSTRVIKAPETSSKSIKQPYKIINIGVTYPNGRIWVHEFKTAAEAADFIKTVLDGRAQISVVWADEGSV